MNSFLPSFQLARTSAPASTALRLPVSNALSATGLPAPLLPPQQAQTAHALASGTAHRAQVLAQRRTSIPSSAKRW